MKKMHIIVILIIVAVFATGTLLMSAFGVSAFGMFIEKPDIKEIESEQLLQVKQTYLDMKMESGYPDYMTAEDVWVEEYCGTYNGCIVMMFTDNEAIYAQAIRVVNVAGLKIAKVENLTASTAEIVKAKIDSISATKQSEGMTKSNKSLSIDSLDITKDTVKEESPFEKLTDEDVDSFRSILYIELEETGKANVLAAIKQLETNED